MADFTRFLAFSTSSNSQVSGIDGATATASFRLAAREAVADMHAKGVPAVGMDENGNIVETDPDEPLNASDGRPSAQKRS